MATFDFNNTKAKPLHEVLPVLRGMLLLQMSGSDVAIPCLVGDAGIGKTASLHAMCKDNDFNLLDIHYGLKPLEEISGMPDFAEQVTINSHTGPIVVKNTRWTLPDILGEAYALSANGKPTVIFLDDFHSSSPGNMALGYEMFTEKKLRGYPFPPNSAFVLAMNCQGAKDLGNTIPAPIVNRISMYKVNVDFDTWKKKFAIPYGINSKILSFLSNSKYTKYFQQEEQVNKPWASARMWTKLSGLITPLEEAGGPMKGQDILYYSEAHVGEAAAAEFTTHYKIFSEVETDKIFDELIEPVCPRDLAGQYVFMLANVSEFFNRFNKKDSNKKGIDKTEENRLIHVMSKILSVVGSVSSEIAVVGAREICTNEIALDIVRKNIYGRVKSQLATLDQRILDKITHDIGAI